MPKDLDSEDLELLRSIIWRRAPKLTHLVDSLGDDPLSNSEREALRDVLLEEFLEVGLAEDDEPNAYGKRVDDLIGTLGNY